MGFSRQEYWSGLPCPPPGDLLNLGIEPRSSTLKVDSLLSEPPEKTKNTRVGCHALFQGIFPTRDQTHVSHIAGGFFTIWATREAQNYYFSSVSMKWSASHSVMLNSLQPHGLQPTRLLCPWNFPSKNTGVNCIPFSRVYSRTQGLNSGLLHCRQILYNLSHKGSNFPLSPCFLQKAVLPSTISINIVKI